MDFSWSEKKDGLRKSGHPIPRMRVLCRYILAWMGFLGFMNVYFSRINISVAIVDMMGVKAANRSVAGNCPDLSNASLTREGKVGEFDWDQNQRGLLLGSYYYGYTVMQIPSAWLATKFGFKRVYGLSMLLSGILTLLFPLAARGSLYLAVALRIIVGVFHAVSFPAMTGAWGSWSPPLETTKLNGIAVSGASAGTCIIFYIAAVIIENLGWEAVFYITGALSIVWVVAWTFLVYDTPALHPRIDKEEREYIEREIGEHGFRQDVAIPWRAIFTSLPVWGIVLGHASSNWGNYTLNQQLPTYLTDVLRFDLSYTGLLSSMCYVLQWIVCVVASWLTDIIRSRRLLSTIGIRKLNTIIGLWVTGLCVGFAGQVGCEAYVAVALFLLSAGLNTFTVPGCKTSMLDMAPAYSGIIFALSNTLSNVPGFVAPQLVGMILVDSTVTEWQTVFWVSCGVHIVGSLLFLFKGTDQLQEWARHAPKVCTDEAPVTNLALELEENGNTSATKPPSGDAEKCDIR